MKPCDPRPENQSVFGRAVSFTPSKKIELISPAPKELVLRPKLVVLENVPKIVLRHDDMMILGVVAERATKGTSWAQLITEFLSAQREANLAALVSSILSKRQYQRELLSLMVSSLTDVWQRLDEFGVGASVRRALSLLIVSARRVLAASNLALRSQIAELCEMRPHKRSVLILAAPNPPTSRLDAMTIAVRLMS